MWRRSILGAVNQPFVAAPGGGGAAYTYRGFNRVGGDYGFDDHTFSMDIGDAAADRVVVVQCFSQNSPGITGVTVNGTSLTQDAANPTGSGRFYSYSGVVSSGSGSQTVVISWTTAGYFDKQAYVWTLTGLSSNTPKATGQAQVTGTDPASISLGTLASGDIVLSSGHILATTDETYDTSSTEAADATRVNSTGLRTRSADWLVNSGGAFSAVMTVTAGGGRNVVAVAYG